MIPLPPIEQEIDRAAHAASGGVFSMRVELVNDLVTLTVGWIERGMTYRHFEVVVADGDSSLRTIQEGALCRALREIVEMP